MSPVEQRDLRGGNVAYLAQSAAATFNPAITINEAAQEGAIFASFEVRTAAEVRQQIINSVDNPDLSGADTVITY